MNEEVKYVYAVKNSHCHVLDGIVFQNRAEASHAIHMVCDTEYKRDFRFMSRKRYNNWLSKIIKDYWAGDYGLETARKRLREALKGQKKYKPKDIWANAVYWDFFEMFYIDKQPIVNDMQRLQNNINEIKKNHGRLY